MLSNVSNPSECLGFMDALVPDVRVELFLPNRDCEGRAFPQLARVERFKSLLSELCGGHAPVLAGRSRYQPPGAAGLSEMTVVISAYLPRRVTSEMKRRL